MQSYAVRMDLCVYHLFVLFLYQEPTADCGLFNKITECRGSGCLWLPHNGTCAAACTVTYDIMVEGTLVNNSVYPGVEQLMDTLEDCEVTCREYTPDCIRYSYYLKHCFLWASYEDEYDQVGAISGIFLVLICVFFCKLKVLGV